MSSRIKYTGASRSNRNKLLRMERSLNMCKEKVDEIYDLIRLSDFLSRVAELPTKQQVTLLKYLTSLGEEELTP